jgi:hypothetical protein
MKQHKDYNPKTCHDYAKTYFNAEVMSKAYLNLYEKVIQGKGINKNIPQTLAVHTPKFLAWHD